MRRTQERYQEVQKKFLIDVTGPISNIGTTMKLLRRLLICFVVFASVVHAKASHWTYLTSARDLTYAVDMDSVATDPDGYVEYVAKTTWKAPAKLSDANRPVAVSVTRYQIDCDRKAWRAVDTHYLASDGTSAGTLHPNAPDWTAIGPGTVIDLMFSKVC
jgi:hypothetical protein